MLSQALTRPSCISRTDPRMRVVLAAVAAVALAPLTAWQACALALILSSLLLLLARPLMKPLLTRLAAVDAFVLFLVVILPLTMPGDHASLLPDWIPASDKGVHTAILIAMKANALALSFMALLASMDAATVGYAMERLHLPPKLVFLFIFTLRFVHTIAEEWTTLRTAAALRGFQATTSRHSYRTIGSLLGVLLLRSHERGRRVHEAMLLRGFNGHFHSVTSFRSTWKDAVLAAFVLSGLSAVVVIELAGRGILPWILP